MPKIIDHEARRIEIAQKAITIFRDYGYSRTSFRELARCLGMSKSGLYHYFTNKEELFVYCGKLLIDQLSASLSPDGLSKVEKCVAFARQLNTQFDAELYLLLDYMRNRKKRQKRDDPLEATLELYVQALSQVTGEEWADSVLRLILGELLLRLMRGGADDDWIALETDLHALLSRPTP